MYQLLLFIRELIGLYIYVIVASVVLSWLVGFGVVNLSNPFVRSVYNGLIAVTEPLLRPIRSILPDLGAIDISPVVLLLACQFVQQVVLATGAGSFLCTYAGLCGY